MVQYICNVTWYYCVCCHERELHKSSQTVPLKETALRYRKIFQCHILLTCFTQQLFYVGKYQFFLFICSPSLKKCGTVIEYNLWSS